jgi:hypothetical protein
MKNINNKSIVFGLKILSILTFVLIFVPFNSVSAEGGINYNYYNASPNPTNNQAEVNNPKPIVNSISPKSSNVGVGTKTITISGSGFVPSSVARVNGSNRPTTFIDASHLLVQTNGNDIYTYQSKGGFFITVFNRTPGGGYSNAVFFTVNNNATASGANTNNVNNSPDTFTETINGTNNDNYSSLASNAIFGSNSFLPSGLIQWVLFGIIILLIVIIARRVFGAREKYEESPMKHA